MLRHVMASDVWDQIRCLGHKLAIRGIRLRDRLQEGQSMVEYAIVAALIAIVAMAAIQALGVGIAGVFQRILNSISGIG